MFFVANTERAARKANCTFAVTGKQPEWLDPVTGTTRALADFTFADGRTTIPLSFEPGQSGFVVFRKDVEAAPAATPRKRSRAPVAERGLGAVAGAV